MDFGLSPEQEALRAETIEFARSELDLAGGSREEFSREMWDLCAKFGVLGSFIDPAYGGRGLDLVSTMVVLEALGCGSGDTGFTLAINGHMWAVQAPIAQFGTEEQKQRLLPGMVAGTLIGADGVTEAESGSDAFDMHTTATARNGGYVLNGEKVYITMGPVCDFAIVFATTDRELGRWGINAFLVDATTPGFTASSHRSKMGLQAAPFGDFTLEDVFVPENMRLGPEGAGASIFAHVMNWERSFIFASQVGVMQRQLDENVEYAQTRQQFGKPIGRFQSVSNRIADMQLRLETSRLLLYKAAWLMDRGEDAQMAAALAKLHIGDSFVESSIDSVRNHGATGYVSEHGVERDLRDAMGGPILGGTADIQRRSIARTLGL